MNRAGLAELLRKGENSGVEFKRDAVTPGKLAREMAALLNLEGGVILLGVEDDGTASGLKRDPKKREEWVMEVARTHLRPGVIPFWETEEMREGSVVGVISLPADAPDKPYKAKRESAWVTQVRVGTTTRDATDDEEMRLYAQSRRLLYDHKPVPGATLENYDMRRLVNYFHDIRRQDCPDLTDTEGWTRFLLNLGLAHDDRGRTLPSVAGLLLFGKRPNRHLPQAGISAVAFGGAQKDYDIKARAVLRGPLVSLFAPREDPFGSAYPKLAGSFAEPAAVIEVGVIEKALDFVARATDVHGFVDRTGRRRERWDYPLDAVREAVVNAVAHRDYTIGLTDIELAVYSDRLEVISPGRLPNTATVEKLRLGYRSPRNDVIRDLLRDYGYIEALGLGIPRKIIAGMRRHNGTEPELIEEESRFTVRLWKECSPAAADGSAGEDVGG